MIWDLVIVGVILMVVWWCRYIILAALVFVGIMFLALLEGIFKVKK